MEAPPNVPPPAWANAARTRVASTVLSGTDAALSVHPVDADTTESHLVPREPAPTKPPYSYKDYTPEPIRVYTCFVSEVGDHLPFLRGPLGFDMEWKVIFHQQQIPRPTAMVRICYKGYIWITQVSCMRKCT